MDFLMEQTQALQSWLGFVTKDEDFNFVFCVAFIQSVVVLLAGNLVESPYGKLAFDAQKASVFSAGISFSPNFGWWLMEFPATVVFLRFYFVGKYAFYPLPLFMCFLYCKHYFNRGWFFPLSIRVAPGTKNSFSIIVAGWGMWFTAMMGYLNAKWFSEDLGGMLVPNGEKNDLAWLRSNYFIIGFFLYEISYWLTIQSEHIMRELRPKDFKDFDSTRNKYKIPYGGLFDLVTSPQYLTELTGWFGWMVITRNPAGLIVFLTSFGNLVPRAFSQHQWYLKKFPEEYPKLNRKALIPFVA